MRHRSTQKKTQKRSRAKVKFNIKRYFQILAIVLVVVVGAGAICLGLNFNKAEEDSGSLVPVDREDGKINVLLLGVDVEGFRTDAIMVASYDIQANKVNLLSIPRDTRMYVGTKYQKINAAHAIGGMTGKIAGPEGTIEAVTRLTGIPINYYVEFSFSAIDNFMNILGPVTFDVPDIEGNGLGMNYDDPVQNLHIHLKPGVQELKGNQVQQLLRYRKSNADKNGKRKGYADGDRGRVEMQQQFVKELVKQKLNPSLILKIPDIFSQMSKDIKTNFTAGDVVKYAKYLQDFSSENIAAYELPGKNNGTDYGASYWICDLEATRELIETVFGYDASNITIDSPDGQSAAKNKKKTATPKPAGTKSTKSGSDNKATPKPTAKATAKPTEKPDNDTPKATPKPTAEATVKPTTKPKATPDSEKNEPSATTKPKATATPDSGKKETPKVTDDVKDDE